MEVEIENAVKQDGGYSRQRSNGCASYQAAWMGQLGQYLFDKARRSSSHDNDQWNTGFGDEMKIVVVGHVIATQNSRWLVLGKNGGIGSRS